MKIAVAGTGYVGLSIALLLAQHHEVVAIDIMPEKISLLNKGRSPIVDTDITDFLSSSADGSHPLRFRATLNENEAYSDTEFVIIATPTDYDEHKNHFNTKSIEQVVAAARQHSPHSWIVIKSTVPVGYTEQLRNRLHDERILFSPEFLREGHALYDNLHPSRIVVGAPQHNHTAIEAAHVFGDLLAEGADPTEHERSNADGSRGIQQLIIGTTEAEAIKLFANTYLALRVAYFNELDTYALSRGLNTEEIITGVCLDPRISAGYNNPSFGYGGYCLPKDSKQLLSNYDNIPQNLIEAIVEANHTRKDFIVQEILARIEGIDSPVVGIYRLTMKSGSDNFRQSAIQDIMRNLHRQGVTTIVYEPTLQASSFLHATAVSELRDFKCAADLIISNRWHSDLDDVKTKVFTRDLFMRD